MIRTRPENELSYYYWTLAEALVVTTTSTFRPLSFCRVGKVLYHVQHARHPLPSADRKLSPWAATWFGCIGCVQGHRCPPSNTKLTPSGFTGSTFRATHAFTGHVVALKVQYINVSYPSNARERAIYPLLRGGVGMPTLWDSGLWGCWDYLAMDLLGNSIDKLYRKAGKNVMDLRSACSIAIQLVRSPPPSPPACPLPTGHTDSLF